VGGEWLLPMQRNYHSMSSTLQCSTGSNIYVKLPTPNPFITRVAIQLDNKLDSFFHSTDSSKPDMISLVAYGAKPTKGCIQRCQDRAAVRILLCHTIITFLYPPSYHQNRAIPSHLLHISNYWLTTIMWESGRNPTKWQNSGKYKELKRKAWINL
jgi:hypothetical protein